MRSWLAMTLLGGCGLLLLSAQAQQPAGKGPMLPPVNPALAKLDITVTDLDGPGFSIAYGSEANLIAAACEHGTIQLFKKETIEAFKAGKGKPEPAVLKGHQGPVRAIAWHGGPTLVSVGADKKINFWKMPELKLASSANSDFLVTPGV